MATAYNPRIVDDGLVLYLDAVNSRSHSGVGTAWNDLSNFGNNFSLSNGAYFENNSINFDGVDDNAGRSVTPSLQLKNDRSLFFWFNQLSSTSAGDNDQVLIRCGLGFDLIYCLFLTRSTRSLKFHWYNSAFLSVNSSSSVYDHDKFNYGGVCIISNVIFFYINGTLLGQANVSTPSPASASLIGIGAARSGGAVGTTGQDFFGSIAQCSVYNRGLSQSEVLQNFNATRGRFGV